MNLASQSGDERSDLLFVNFSQDCASLAVGKRSGYTLFSLSSVDTLDPIYENATSEDICIVERLFSSSLVAIVSLSTPQKLKVCHFKKGTEICNYSYSNSILAVKLNRQRLIVCLEESLYIHNIRDMKVLHTVRDTPINPRGLCALSIHSENCFLAYPGSTQIGELQIFDTINLCPVTVIVAHNNPVAALAFNAQGTKLATASEKGTVIRVFSIPDGLKLFEFRRGLKRCVNINSLAFSSDSVFLCSSSNTETVHIFKLELEKDSNPQEDQTSWMGFFNSAIKQSATYLPGSVTDIFNQGRSFATCKLPTQGFKNVCAIAIIQKLPRLLVASQDGYFYIYNLDPNDGGECTLVIQHRLSSQQFEGGQSVPPSSAVEKPLTQTSSPISYASSLKRAEPSSNENSPPRHHTGKPVRGYSLSLLSMSPCRLESYATVVQQSRGGPQCVDVNQVTEIDIILNGRDSQPFQEFERGTISPDLTAGVGLNALRLDDDNEFPPMTHKVD